MLYTIVKRDSNTKELLPTDINKNVGPLSEYKALALSIKLNRIMTAKACRVYFRVSPILDI